MKKNPPQNNNHSFDITQAINIVQKQEWLIKTQTQEEKERTKRNIAKILKKNQHNK